MYSLLLAVIYLIFISLGLPDSLLGSGWPTMQVAFGVPSSYAGYVYKSKEPSPCLSEGCLSQMEQV